MRLKSLEIKGFKSFADKTVIRFDNNITGIVGPNGCGKSNIVDSIRWVIGEQKISHLRSENLESLVFNGSKTRSASGLAEVSLTFENTRNLLPTEFHEVTITRKFYKSGESEYRLNDVQCRLKDIQNLLLDTGISSDSYAIIELGMVDEIIKDKDNSRRRMLEQAAGISIYKARKKEARQKLEATESDLGRIEDLLYEINNQLKTLESQAKKAEKYHEIKKEYKEVSIELAKAALESFNVTIQELNRQMESETEKKLKTDAQVALSEAELEKQKLVFLEKEKELQVLHQSYNSLTQKLSASENEKKLVTQKIEHLKEKESGIRDFLSNTKSQISSLEGQLENLQQQIQCEMDKLEEQKKQLEELRSEVDLRRNRLDEKRKGIDYLRKEQQQIQHQLFETEKKVAVAETSLANLHKMVQQIQDEKNLREGQRHQLDQERIIKEKELSIKKSDLEQLIRFEEKTKEQIRQTVQEIEELKNLLAEEGRKLDARKNEYDLLKSMIDSMEGYPESVRFLHQHPQWNHSAPVLSDVIHVKEDYRVSIEMLLEPYLSYYIVNDIKEGLQAVNLLDEHKKGKANFFLLDQLHKKMIQEKTPCPPGFTPAIQVVECEDLYLPLVHYLLGHVWIAESADMPEEFPQHVIIVDKSGKYAKGQYVLTGGSVGIMEGKKIGRVRNLEKLKEEIQKQEEKVNQLQVSIEEKQALIDAFHEELRETVIKDTHAEIQKLTNVVFSLHNKLENLHSLQSASLEKLEELNHQIQQTAYSSEGLKHQLSAYHEQLLSFSSRFNESESEYQIIESEYNEVNKKYNELFVSVTRQQSKIDSLRQELNFKNQQLKDFISQIEQNEQMLQDTVSQIQGLETRIHSLQEEVLHLLFEKEKQEKELSESDRIYYEMRNQIQAKESEIRQYIKEKEQTEYLLTAIKDKLNEVKLHLTGMKERLDVEFRININDILGESRNSQESQEILQEKADKLRKRLENMGDVNPMAMEAFVEMKKRYDFIQEQKNDLINARDSLLKTIEEVEQTANQKFLETFEQVRQNFRKVFKTLFTEDDECDLILEQPDNLSETGIEVVAKPKGKRPLSLTQLSGGERALTATALLFAIYLIKPAPFCILDEVDAPLDDANVGKFTRMIREFSDKSQFIIVTHNKMTMSAVDVIYGVTMQEPGVSKLVPVDFRGLEN
ncbi:MAG: chromosome segregation protein SMC [Chitinophagaceae bacterium]|nr:chromosome segregation protein SMC [Chitinophagaceae bacterium]